MCRKKSMRFNISYRKLIIFCILLLLATLSIAFIAINLADYRYHEKENARNEVKSDALQLSKRLDDRLEGLMDYYRVVAVNDNISYFMDNTVGYSDYSRYTGAKEVLYNNQEGAVSGFLLANFRSGWVLTDRALFQTNTDTFAPLLDFRSETASKYFWVYRKEKDHIAATASYRDTMRSFKLEGLNLVFQLPMDTFNEHGLLVVNISPVRIAQYFASWLGTEDSVIILDEKRDVVLSTDDRFFSECLELGRDEVSQRIVKKEDSRNSSDYLIGRSTPALLPGWDIYLVRKANPLFNFGFSSQSMLMFGIFIAVTAVFALLAFLLYRPVGKLVKSISTTGGHADGDSRNEFTYIETRFQDLAKDRESLSTAIVQQRSHIEELFMLRLLRGEVSEESYQEYVDVLGLQTGSLYATSVVSFEGNVIGVDDVSDDAVCLKILQEAPDSLFEGLLLPPACNAGVLFTIFPGSGEVEVQEKIGVFFSRMKEYVGQRFGMEISMGVSGFHSNYTHVHSAYRECIRALIVRSEPVQGIADGGSATSGIYPYIPEITEAYNSATKEHWDEGYFRDIELAVETMDEAGCMEITDSLFANLGESKNGHEVVVEVLGYVNHALRACIRCRIDVPGACGLEVSQIYQGVLNAKSLEWMCSFIKHKFLEPAVKSRKETVQGSYRDIVQDVYAHIREKSGNTTLYECADSIGVDSASIWNALRISTGRTFSEVVENYRYEEAKRILLITDMKVNDIAASLGYSNAQNFIRFFNKMSGMSPGKFRRLNDLK